MTKTQLKKLETQKNKLRRSQKKKVNVYQEINNYLFSGSELSDEALSSKTQFRTAVTYLFESFMKMPGISIYLDKHLNLKTEGLISHEPYKILEFYKKLIYENNIKGYHVYKFFPNRTFQTSINTLVSKKGFTIREAKDYYINRKVINIIELNSLLENKASKNNDDIEIINKVISERLVRQKPEITPTEITPTEITTTEITLKDNVFLENINNDVINAFGLTLFDISVLRKSNEFLYIFIDKNNRKKYYKEPFQVEFYINLKTGVLNNNYIEPLDKNFQKYTINDIQDLSSLKFLLSKIYKQFMKDI
jgi:hypothetical protein